MTKPTYQDATLMIQLAQWGAAVGVSEGWSWMLSDEFVPDHAGFMEKYPPGSEGYRKAIDICMWMETIGTLHKNGLFNEELLFDWLGVSPMWERMKGFALGERERLGMPRLWENFEATAKAQRG